MADPARSPAPASAFPMAGSEARFQRFRVGAMDIVVLSDGGIPVPRPPGAAGAGGIILRPLCCLLVRLPGPGGLVLMDAGFGPHAKRAGQSLPTAGRLLESLADAGVAPGDIGTVLVSHIHPDHVDGLYDDDGTAIFPNATYRVGAEELAYWSQPNLDLSWSPAPPPVQAEMLATAKRLLGFAGNTLQTFRAGEPAMPGIDTIPLPGHTPGQVGFILSDDGDHLVNTADAVTTVEASIWTPDAKHPLDLDPELGIRTRKALLATLVERGWRSFSPHFPWPNLGTVGQEGERYVWQPATSPAES